jgi:CheY-like chemotaxis protein
VFELIEQNDYDIHFIDWIMPEMNGNELAEALKRKGQILKDSVVVMVSAADTSMVAAEAKEAGVDRFIQKPLFPSTIVDIASECLGMSARQKEEETTDDIEFFKGHCILLAEDVEINREIVLALLEPTKLTVECAENGAEAVRMFSKSPDKYNMIFMDIQMPEMDGYEATRSIRRLDIPQAKIIPIIAMTANVFREDIEKCLEAGMQWHIGKPIDLNDIIRQLKQYLL